MKYSETGQFTKEQIELAKNISRSIKKLRDSGCFVYAKQCVLQAYLDDDIAHSEPFCNINNSDGYRIPSLYCGLINGSGSDDTEFFERGYITEE